jgi:TPR repeat protein
MALAFMYARGEGIARDPARAARWWRAAADQGQGYAQFAFAEAALNGGGTVRDPVLAHAYLTIAAERTQRGGPFLELVRETLAQATAALDADGRAASAAFVAAWYEARPALAPPERLLPAPASPPTPEER